MTRVNSIDDLPPRAREQARRQLAEQERHSFSGRATAKSVQSDQAAKSSPRFTNVRTVASDGLRVPSKGQAARHEHLLRLQAIHTIWGLESEVPFALIVNGIQVGTYIADEVYWMWKADRPQNDESERVIEDFKAVPSKPKPGSGKRRGEGTATALYKLKKAIMGAMGLRVREVHKAASPAGWDESK